MTEWTDFVKKYAKSHSISYREALKGASKEYNKKTGTKGATNISRVRKERKEGRGDTKDYSTKKGTLIKHGRRKGQKAYAMDK